MRITIVGTVYVGLVTGTCFANTGNDVLCLDVETEKIAMLQEGCVPFFEPGLEEMVRRNVATGRLQFSTDKHVAYRSAELVFICVGTPSDDDGRADLRYVLGAARDMANVLNAAPAATASPPGAATGATHRLYPRLAFGALRKTFR